MTESESELCSKISLAEMRIDYALKEYNQCKNAAFLAGTKWDEEMTRLINKVKDEYYNRFYNSIKNNEILI